MEIKKTKQTNFETVENGIAFGGNALSNSLNTLNENGEEQEKKGKKSGSSGLAHPQDFLREKEKKKWNRMSPRKRGCYQEKGKRSTQHFKKSGIQLEEQRNAENVKQSRFGKTASQEMANNQKPIVKTGVNEGVKQGAKATTGAATGGVSVAASEAKKTAEKFREALQKNNIQEKAEILRAENKERNTFLELGKYIGATVAIVLAPVISILATTVTSVISTIISFFIPLIIIITIFSTVLSFLVMLLGGGGAQSQQETVGYFGARWYWIEYETGRTDENAFATVLGDNGAAFGIQFDYRYTLQAFMNECYQDEPIMYGPFLPYIQADKETLKGNQGLANVWKLVFENSKEDFINRQKQFANNRYYVPAEQRLVNAGIRIEDRSEVCKGAVLSFMFQGCRMGIVNAVNRAGITNASSDEEFVTKLYQYRREQYSRFESRYLREEQTALGLLRQENVVAGKGFLSNPCPDGRVSSEYGPRPAPKPGASTNHKGRDYAAPSGTPIYAGAAGVVKTTSSNKTRGSYLVIDHGNGIETWYQHCASVIVLQGAKVTKGQKVATVGSTGIATGPHLHFEVHRNGTPVDPRNYL